MFKIHKNYCALGMFTCKKKIGEQHYLSVKCSPALSKIRNTHHNVWCRLGGGRQDIHTLGGEVTLASGAVVLAVAQAALQHRVTVLVLKDDQVTALETQEG